MGRPLRVLIVEDSEDDAQLVLREIRKAGYEPTYERVDTAPAMKAALEKQEWDLVLADYNMPEFSGPAALGLLKKEGLDLPFILVSGAIGEEAAVAAMKAGAHDFVMKDSLARLVPACERELHEAEMRREQKRAQDEIRQLKEFNEEIVQQMEGGIIRLDGNLMITFLNPKALEMLGYEKGEVKGEPFGTICRDRGECQEHLRKMNEEMRPVKFECTLAAKDGRELTVLNSCTPLFRDGKLTGYLSTLADITEWKAAEEEYIEKGLKYDLEKGKLYLSEETGMEKAMDAFQDLLKAGYGGMVITRRHPEEVREEHQLGKEVPIYWLAAEASAEANVLQPEFPVIEKEVRSFLGRRRVLLLDRLEYLVSQRGFDETLAFVQRLHELAYSRKGIVIFSINSAAFPPHQLALLRSEALELERKEGPAIPEDLLEILQFVYQENREGRKPTHKATSKRFGFSRMTRLRKISQLKALGLIADEPKGRMKVLWVTEKGKDLL